MPPPPRPSSPLEKFPPIEEEGDDHLDLRTETTTNNSLPPLSTKLGNNIHKYPPVSLWKSRQNGTIPRPFGIGRKQRPRKSISETIGSMRTQSVSENAQDIADALKAPVSYRLIVRET